MKRLFLPLLVLCLIGCSDNVAPTFKRIKNIKVKELNLRNITIESELVYSNPNRFGGNVMAFDIDVIVNDINVGKLKQIGQIEILAKQDFVLPSTISFPPKQVFKSDNFFKSALQVFANEKADVQYLGTMTINIAGLDFEIPVKHKEQIPLKKSK